VATNYYPFTIFVQRRTLSLLFFLIAERIHITHYFQVTTILLSLWRTCFKDKTVCHISAAWQPFVTDLTKFSMMIYLGPPQPIGHHNFRNLKSSRWRMYAILKYKKITLSLQQFDQI